MLIIQPEKGLCHALLWWLFTGLLMVTMACNALGGIGGQCHDSNTGEVLNEVLAGDGELWPVEKMPNPVRIAGTSYEYCGISVATPLFQRGTIEYVKNPETEEDILVGGLFDSGGMISLSGHEWY